MASFNKLTIENLPARIEFHAREKKLSFDLPAWDEFKKDVGCEMTIEAMRRKWNTRWATMAKWVEISKEKNQ